MSTPAASRVLIGGFLLSAAAAANAVTLSAPAAIFSTDFSRSQNFAQGVGSTGWSGAYLGNNPGSTFSSAGGLLTLSDTNGFWENGSHSGHLLYIQITGDFTAQCKLESINTVLYSTAGIGIFDPSVTTNSATVTWFGAYEKGFHVGGDIGTRVIENGSQADYEGYVTGMNASPVWLKVQRLGQNMLSYYSMDGAAWTQMKDVMLVDMPETVSVGLWAGSFRSGNTTVATFSSFSAQVVPEPSTYGLMLGGLALVGAASRRRRRA